MTVLYSLLFSPDDRVYLMQALKAEKYHGDSADYSFDIRPFSYQQEILDKLTAEVKYAVTGRTSLLLRQVRARL